MRRGVGVRGELGEVEPSSFWRRRRRKQKGDFAELPPFATNEIVVFRRGRHDRGRSLHSLVSGRCALCIITTVV